MDIINYQSPGYRPCPHCYLPFLDGYPYHSHEGKCQAEPRVWDQLPQGIASNKRLINDANRAQTTSCAKRLREIDAESRASHINDSVSSSVNAIYLMPSICQLAMSTNDPNAINISVVSPDTNAINLTVTTCDTNNEEEDLGGSSSFSMGDTNDNEDNNGGSGGVNLDHVVDYRMDYNQPIMEKNPFKKGAPLPAGMVFQVHLEDILRSHRGIHNPSNSCACWYTLCCVTRSPFSTTYSNEVLSMMSSSYSDKMRTIHYL
jgi:hypothetical protein